MLALIYVFSFLPTSIVLVVLVLYYHTIIHHLSQIPTRMNEPIGRYIDKTKPSPIREKGGKAKDRKLPLPPITILRIQFVRLWRDGE